MQRFSRAMATILFTASGVLHLVKPAIFEQIVPPALPAPGVLVAVSGVAEIAGAIGVAIPRTRRAASYGLIALLVAVFPANIYMAVDAQRFASLAPAWLLWARVPFQFILIAWAWSLRK